MPLIEIDQESFDRLKAHEQISGEPPSALLRSLLGLDRRSRGRGKPHTGGSDLDRFLRVLSDAHQVYSDRFQQIDRIRGRTRKYFSKDPDEIRATGQSTAPVRIPATDWWVTSNTSTDRKLRILTRVFDVLRVSIEHRQRWLAEFSEEETKMISTRTDADEDPFKI